VSDAAQLADALRASRGELPDGVSVPAAARAGAVEAARQWLAWYATQGFADGAGTAWSAERMEYGFAVSAATSRGEVVLVADEYAGGTADWYAYSIDPSATLGAAPAGVAIEQRAVPAPVAYAGMPSPRLWQFEDGRVNLAAIEQGPDLARTLVVEFALVYGSDWFVVPVEQAASSLARIGSLVVESTFGERFSVPHTGELDGPDTPWRLFGLTVDGAAAGLHDVFVLPAALPGALESEPLEEVMLLRDELANIAWAVEQRVQAPDGSVVDRFAAYQAEQRRRLGPVPAPPAAAGVPRYRLGSTVPDFWIPLVPEDDAAAPGRLRLRLGAMPRVDAAALGPPIEPAGQLLATPALALYEEEVPREGARVTRSYRSARSADGATHVWVSRAKRPGRGEGSSGLRFDTLEDA
jgi:hypothetical protein